MNSFAEVIILIVNNNFFQKNTSYLLTFSKKNFNYIEDYPKVFKIKLESDGLLNFSKTLFIIFDGENDERYKIFEFEVEIL